jgi:hypothetical protein
MQSVGILEPLLGHVGSKIPAVESRLSSNQTVRLSGCGLKYRKTASRQQHALMPLKPWCLSVMVGNVYQRRGKASG